MTTAKASICAISILSCLAQVEEPREPHFKADVRLAVADVAVRSPAGSNLANLQKKDFEVFCGAVPQSIVSIDSVGLPADVVVLVDAGWPNGFIPDEQFERSLDIAVAAVGETVATMGFAVLGASPRVITRLTDSRRELRDAVQEVRNLRTKARPGSASLESSIPTALALLSARDHDKYRRRMIVVLGYDQDSLAEHLDLSALRRALDESDVQVLAIRFPLQRFKGRANFGTVLGDAIRDRAGSLAGVSQPPKHGYETLINTVGGRLIDATSNDAAAVLQKQFDELKTLYRLWFVPRPENRASEGWLKLTVTLSPLATVAGGQVESWRPRCPY
ncbi:MAG: hypothetical protein K2X00_18815 [Nitrospiraceae bacterium]|nr:hypothetical protein [Nitrospiraceae bacterium]